MTRGEKMTRSDRCAELIAKIEARTARIAVIGLGYVGLPLALTFAKKRLFRSRV